MSERREIIMRRDKYHLEPASPAESEALLEYPEDKDLWVSIRRKRSNAHHSLYWKMLQRVIASGATRYHSEGVLHDAIKFELGYWKPLVKLSGEVVPTPGSISFDQMDQTEFNKFFDAAVRLIGEHFGIDPLELKG